MNRQNWIRILSAGLLVAAMAGMPAAAEDIMSGTIISEDMAAEDVLIDDAVTGDALFYDQQEQEYLIDDAAEEIVTGELLNASEEDVDEVLFEEETEELTEKEFLSDASAEETPEIMFETETAPELKLVSMSRVNPLYKDIIDEDSLESVTVSNEVMLEALLDATSGNATVFSTIESAGEYMRNQLKARNEEITINYQFSDDYEENIVDSILDVAFAHTGGPTEGDYLSFQYGMWSMSGAGNGDIYTMSFQFSYYTNLSQELQMNAAVAKAMSEMSLDNKSTYNKIYTIHQYVCDHVTYDYDHLGDSSYKLQFTAYAALINRTAVCQGYAVLMYRLMLEAGIDCRVITGYASSGGGGGGHAWNIVKLGQYYYYVDATWDDGAYYLEYFLRCSYDDHWPYEDDFPEAFFVEYPLGPVDYDPALTEEIVTMYRLYNPYTGEHLYTGNLKERYNLVSAGWQYDGEAWKAPVNSSIKVYRLYNPYDDFHFYSANEAEIANLVSYGWVREGIAWCSDEAKGVPIYRLFNPYETTNYHMFTTSTAERDQLVSYGWQFEGVAFYGVK